MRPEIDTTVLGWPADEPTLKLDHSQFPYAGKFRMSTTGKIVANIEDSVVGAVAFNEDRTNPDALWVRYLSIRDDLQGRGIAHQLLEAVIEQATSHGYRLVRIAVSNPHAVSAAENVGFGYTGRETGLNEVVLEWPADDRGVREAYHVMADTESLPEQAKRYCRQKLAETGKRSTSTPTE